MEPGDYTLRLSGQLGEQTSVSEFKGKFVGEFDTTKDALREIRERMGREQCWPRIWWVPDHGKNYYWQIDIEGREIKSV